MDGKGHFEAAERLLVPTDAEEVEHARTRTSQAGPQGRAMIDALNITQLTEHVSDLGARSAPDIALDLLTALDAQGWRLIHV